MRKKSWYNEFDDYSSDFEEDELFREEDKLYY